MVLAGNQVLLLDNVPSAGQALEAKNRPEPSGSETPSSGKKEI